jgi:hypothetical protein
MAQPGARLEIHGVYRYDCTMLGRKLRRFFAVFLALALAVGVVGPYFPLGNLANKAAAMSMDTASDPPMQSKCNGCAGDENGMIPTGCAPFCGYITASPLVPVHPGAILATLLPPAERTMTGLTGPPDPYPPKPVV